MHETEFLMHVPCDVADPIVIKPILGELGLALRQVDIGGVRVTKYYAAREGMPLDQVDYVLVGLIFDKVHYRYACAPIQDAKDPPQLREMPHVAPLLLPYQCLIDIYLISEADVFLDVLLDVAADSFSDDDEKVSHRTIIHQEVSLPGVAVVSPQLHGHVKLYEVDTQHWRRIVDFGSLKAHGTRPRVLVNLSYTVH